MNASCLQPILFSLLSCFVLINACSKSLPKPSKSAHEDHDPSTEKKHDEHGEESHETGHTDGPHDDHDDEEGAVKLSPQALRSSSIQVAPVQQGSLDQSIAIPAEVELNPDHVAHISPLVEGQLLGVQVKLGDRVKREQELTSIRSVVLGQARAEYSRARAVHGVSKRTLERQKTLRREGINSQQRLLEAELAEELAKAELNAARWRLKVFGVQGGAGPDMAIESPIEGIVMERHATRGESVTPQNTLFTIADLSTVWVMGRAYAQHINVLRVGMPVNVTLDVYPGRSWTGKIGYISSKLEESTRTLPIRVEIENKDELLKPGMFGMLHISSNDASDAASIMVPQTAVLEVKGRDVVFIPGDHDSEFQAVPVTVGRRNAGQVEVLKGLKKTSRVVVQGGFVLKSELMRAELGEGHAH